MMARWRDEFIAAATRAGIATDDARKLLRYTATLHRLSEAQCNGDYPADNGERKALYCGGAESAGCATLWAPAALKGKKRLCPDCRTQALVSRVMAGYPAFRVEFQGDPRGCVVKLHHVDAQGIPREIGVPA